MSSIHFKFKSSMDYDTLTFDGLHISLADLKKAIIQKKMGKNNDFDLQVTNAQTKEVYSADTDLVPKNASVIVSRIPIVNATSSKNKSSNSQGDTATFKAQDDYPAFDKMAKASDLAGSALSEEDKIKAMISQSTKDYDPTSYIKHKRPTGIPSRDYKCFKCGMPGHYVNECPKQLDPDAQRLKKSTGIPRSFLTEVDDRNVPGVLQTPGGKLVVPTIDAEAYRKGKKEPPPFLPAPEPVPEPEEHTVPSELLCPICKDIFNEAVIISCCGNSFCDDCIRNTLLQSENHVCPSCGQEDSSPDKLVANQFLRTAVRNFRNETGYARAGKKTGASSVTAQAKPYDSPSQPVVQNNSASADVRKVASSSNLSRMASPYSSEDASAGSTMKAVSSSDNLQQAGETSRPSSDHLQPRPYMPRQQPQQQPWTPQDPGSPLRMDRRMPTPQQLPQQPSSLPPDQPYGLQQQQQQQQQQQMAMMPPQQMLAAPMPPMHPAMAPRPLPGMMAVPPGPPHLLAPPLRYALPPGPMLTSEPPMLAFNAPPMPFVRGPPVGLIGPGMPPVVQPPMLPQPGAPWDAVRLPLPPVEKPLSEVEFYRAQDRLRLGKKDHHAALANEFVSNNNSSPFSRRPRSKSRSRSRSRSYSRPRDRYQSRSRSPRSRSRSRPMRSRSRSKPLNMLSPRRRQFSRSRSRSPPRSGAYGSPRSRSNSPQYKRSPPPAKRSSSPRRSRSRSPGYKQSPPRGGGRKRSRSRSYSRSPAQYNRRLRSTSRGRKVSRSRSRSPQRARRSSRERPPNHSDSRWDEYWKQYREWYERYGNFYAEMQRHQKPPAYGGPGPAMPPGVSADWMMRGGKPRSPYDRPRSPDASGKPRGGPYDARGPRSRSRERGPPRDDRDRRPPAAGSLAVNDRYARAPGRDERDVRDRREDKPEDVRDRRVEKLVEKRDDRSVDIRERKDDTRDRRDDARDRRDDTRDRRDDTREKRDDTREKRDDTRDRRDDARDRRDDTRDRRDDTRDRRDDTRDRRDDVRLQPENGSGKDSGRSSDSRSVRDSAAEAQSNSNHSKQPVKRSSDSVVTESRTDRKAEAEPVAKRIKREDENKAEQEPRRSPSAGQIKREAPPNSDSIPKGSAEGSSQQDSKQLVSVPDAAKESSKHKHKSRDSKRKSTDSDKEKRRDRKSSRTASTEEKTDKISVKEDHAAKKLESKEKAATEPESVRERGAVESKPAKGSAALPEEPAAVSDTAVDTKPPPAATIDASQKDDSLVISRPPPSKWEVDDYDKNGAGKHKKDKKKDKVPKSVVANAVISTKPPPLMSLQLVRQTSQSGTGVTRTVVNTLTRDSEKRAVSSGDNSVKVTIHSSSDKAKTVDISSSKAPASKRNDRKISVVEESAFEPDYGDNSSESDDDKGTARTVASASSANDAKDKKEKKKHKKEKKKHKNKDKDPERKKHKKIKRKNSE